MERRLRLEVLEEILKEVERVFPEVYAEGLRSCRSGSVKKYLFPDGTTIWLVVGKHGEYIVSEATIDGRPSFVCSCPDFLFHVLLKSSREGIRRRRVCYHIVARVAAELNEIKRELGEDYDPRCLPEEFLEEPEYLMKLIWEVREGIAEREHSEEDA